MIEAALEAHFEADNSQAETGRLVNLPDAVVHLPWRDHSLQASLTMDFATLRSRICARLTQRVYASVWRHVRENPPQSLWGVEKPPSFLEATMCYTIYADLHRCGINRLRGKFDLGFRLSNKSVDHNIRKMRKVLATWGDNHVVLGAAHAWDHAAINVDRPEPFEVIQNSAAQSLMVISLEMHARPSISGSTARTFRSRLARVSIISPSAAGRRSTGRSSSTSPVAGTISC